MPSINLFISYRSLDSSKVDPIVHRLNTRRTSEGESPYTTWQDKRDMPVGQNWWESIVNAIIKCDVFVFHISQEALKSEVCKAELAYALERNRFIIPVVLEGEFFYNNSTGKHDIDYWSLMPIALTRLQLLFYTGTDFFNQFQKTIDLYKANPPRNIDAPRPLEPDGMGQRASDMYHEACDYAGRLAFDEARKRFQRLTNSNDSDFGATSYEWIGLLHQYEEILKLYEKTSTQFVARNKWGAYKALFPKEFINGIFDPKDIGTDISALLDVTQQKYPPVQGPTTLARPRSIDLMPWPFAWIDIPMGKVRLEKGGLVGGYVKRAKTYEVSNFRIGKYLITNAQYRRFMEANGYSDKRWWTEIGWATKEEEKWIEPAYWHDRTCSGEEQPVVGVSWYESVAFCQWLSLAAEEDIRLPSEQEWQRAAQGDQRLIYPWGDEWDGSRCNNQVLPQKSSQTTPVRRYEEKGKSQYGVVDMAGNVWEWCITDFTDGSQMINNHFNKRVLRGGSWAQMDTEFFRTFQRSAYHPGYRNQFFGFRCVQQDK